MLRTERSPSGSAVTDDAPEWPDVRLEMAAGHDALDHICDGLDALWTPRSYVPACIRMQVGIAATEITMNIIEHSSARFMSVRAHAGLTQIYLNFTDDGRPAVIDLPSVRMPDEYAESGRGLALALATLDSLAYQHDQLGNHWTLISKPFGDDD